MKIKDASFFKSCNKFEQYPGYTYPEYAFFGRSNVGKSSLLNMILGKKGLVKTGSRPGVTQMINFFTVNDNRSFADLPGFGYAKVPAEIRKKFMPMIKEYIEKRDNLKLAFLLIDVRRVPGDYEKEIIELLLKNSVPVAVTITKCDKVSKSLKQKNVNIILETLEIGRESVILTSSVTNEGRKEILSLIEEYSDT